MKNLLAYTPEPFDNLELENFEYAPLAGEGEMEEGEVRKNPRRRAVGKTPRRFSPTVRKVKPLWPKVRPMFPFVPPRSGAAASLNVFPPADDRRPAGQSSSSGNAGGEGSFGNAPAQDVSSEHVLWVQETLNRALGLRLIVDGIMNRETRSAVRMFQERKGLPITGFVGPDTEEALRAEGGQAAAEPEPPEGEWEMEHPANCFCPSCYGKEMEEFGLEAELFGEAEFEVDEYSASSPNQAPHRLGLLLFQRKGTPIFRYQFTPDDLLWTARLIFGEAGARDDLENRAVIAAMLNRFALFTHRVYPTFNSFLRGYSTPLQPVLLNKNVAKHYMNDSRFVQLGGTYKGTNIPRGQLKRHLDLQKTPWERLSPLARKIALEALTGQMSDTGIGLASEFASTWILYGRQVGAKNRTESGWLDYTKRFKNDKGWRWIGHKPNLNQKRNAFFVDPRAISIAPDSVKVVPPKRIFSGELSPLIESEEFAI